ncbi:MAG: hypothetical protein K6E33_05130 [Lachnospiraceae bacterium]|nr:hypothetical protein [Lachnospiraceae bacterium]
MSGNEKSIFRKESIDRLESPEQLNQYIHVTRPSVWILFAAITMLLGGVMYWMLTGEMETHLTAVTIVESGRANAYVDAVEVDRITEGCTVIVGETENSRVKYVSETTIRVPEEISSDFLELTGPGEKAYVVTLEDVNLPDGVYYSDIIVDVMRPHEYLLGVE